MASAVTIEKPSYLGLLNAISLAESAAGTYLDAWANVTPNPDLACTLRLVAARETSHGEVFRRRIEELGFSLRQNPDPRAAERLARLANPNIGDRDKIPSRREEASDPFADIRRRMAEGDFDPMTVNLMNWYIAEEKDSEKRLNEAYDCVRGTERKRDPRATPDAPSADAEAIMACMTAGFARLEKAMERVAKAKKS